MVIESRLDKAQLRNYRRWKQDVRVSLRHFFQTIESIKEDRSLKRLVDRDFFPLFICGVAGSGTTLIGALLDQNFQNRLNFITSDRSLETSRLLWREKASSYDSLDDYVDDLFSPIKQPVWRIRSAVLGLYRRSANYPYSSPIVIDKTANSHLVRIGVLRKAFPDSGIILVYRDPVETIEGLKRKWPKLYSPLSIEELCDFWCFLYSKFLEACEYCSDLTVISYNNLVEQSPKVLESISERYKIAARSEIKTYKNKGNRPGKGIRNIRGGKIQIVREAFEAVSKTVSEEEVHTINNRTRDMYLKLEGLNSFSLDS